MQRNKRHQKNDKSPEKSVLFIKGTNEATEYEVKDQKGRFLGMLLGTLGTGLS